MANKGQEIKMEKSDMEKAIEDAVMKGKMGAGIYDAGLSLVVVDVVVDDVSFRWFDHVMDIADYIAC